MKKKEVNMKKLALLLVAVALLAALVGCGSSNSLPAGSSSTVGGTPTSTSMAGSWDFTVTPTGASVKTPNNLSALEAVLTQSGTTISSSGGTVTTTGPAGNLWFLQLDGTALANVTAVGFEVAPTAGCKNIGSGPNTVTSGTITGSAVTLVISQSGNLFDVSGTLSSATPPTFTGTVQNDVTNTTCPITANVTGVVASSLTGTYLGSITDSGTAYPLSVALTANTDGTLSLNGTTSDPKSGNITGHGTFTGNALTFTAQGSAGGNAGTLFGYFDPSLGAKGTIVLTQLDPTGCSAATFDNGWCVSDGGMFVKQ